MGRLNPSMELFQDILDQSNDLICIVDLETTEFLYINDAVKRILGFTKEEFLKLGAKDLDVNLKGMEQWDSLLNTIKQKGYALWESQSRRKDGSLISIEVSVKFVIHSNKKYVVGILRDITDRKKIEKEIIILNDQLKAKIEELEKFNKVAIDRELKMIELKNKIKELEKNSK